MSRSTGPLTLLITACCFSLVGCNGDLGPQELIGPQELTGKIVFDELVSGEGFQIFVMNADGSGVTRLTHTNGSKVNPGWSPDGSRIVFQRFGLFGGDIHVMNADGTGNTTILRGSWSYPDWSPDGS